jgi:hypothetical protein
MNLRSVLGFGFVLAACGGNAAPPADPTPTAAPSASAAVPAPAGSDDKHTAAEAAPHVDPKESSEPITLAALFDKKTKSAFPKQTVADHDCLSGLHFTGHHQADFATLIGQCGTPTGMLEYTKPHEGRLHVKHDVRDEFKVSVQKGMCYRYFAVADDGIKDIDMIILRKGSLLGTDHANQQVAVIDAEKLWCIDEDEELQFNIEVDGRGAGGYTFGVWARPNQ